MGLVDTTRSQMQWVGRDHRLIRGRDLNICSQCPAISSPNEDGMMVSLVRSLAVHPAASNPCPVESSTGLLRVATS
jgi:hypothetical protein